MKISFFRHPMTETAVKQLLFLELVSDLYHSVDALKRSNWSSPGGSVRAGWFIDLEKTLRLLGLPRQLDPSNRPATKVRGG